MLDGSAAHALVLSGQCNVWNGKGEGLREGLSLAIHHTTSQVGLTVVHCPDIRDEIRWADLPNG